MSATNGSKEIALAVRADVAEEAAENVGATMGDEQVFDVLFNVMNALRYTLPQEWLDDPSSVTIEMIVDELERLWKLAHGPNLGEHHYENDVLVEEMTEEEFLRAMDIDGLGLDMLRVVIAKAKKNAQEVAELAPDSFAQFPIRMRDLYGETELQFLIVADHGVVKYMSAKVRVLSDAGTIAEIINQAVEGTDDQLTELHKQLVFILMYLEIESTFANNDDVKYMLLDLLSEAAKNYGAYLYEYLVNIEILNQVVSASPTMLHAGGVSAEFTHLHQAFEKWVSEMKGLIHNDAFMLEALNGITNTEAREIIEQSMPGLIGQIQIVRTGEVGLSLLTQDQRQALLRENPALGISFALNAIGEENVRALIRGAKKRQVSGGVHIGG